MSDWKKHFEQVKKKFPKLGESELAKMAMLMFQGAKGGEKLRDQNHGNVQAVIFDKIKWPKAESDQWLKTHGFVPMKGARLTKNFRRYRIKTPEYSNESYTFTKKLDGANDGIELVIQGHEQGGGFGTNTYPLFGGFGTNHYALLGQEQKGGWIPTANNIESLENSARYQIPPQSNQYAVDFTQAPFIGEGLDYPPSSRPIAAPKKTIININTEAKVPSAIVSNAKTMGGGSFQGPVNRYGVPISTPRFRLQPQPPLFRLPSGVEQITGSGQFKLQPYHGQVGGLYRDPGFHGPDPSGQSGSRPFAVFH